MAKLKDPGDSDSWDDLKEEAKPILVKSYWFEEPLILVGTYGWDGEYPIYWDLLEKFVQKVKAWVKSDHQAVIVISGRTGTGKSNLGIQMARTFNRDWDIHTNLLYGGGDLSAKLRLKNPDPVNLFDEGSMIFNSLDTISKEGKNLAVLFDMLRSRHMISIIVLPDDSELNKRISKHVDWWIECPSEAPIPGYSPRGFFHIRDRVVYRKSGKVWENLLGTGVFPPISKKMDNIYQAIKKEKQDEYMRSIGVLE